MVARMLRGTKVLHPEEPRVYGEVMDRLGFPRTRGFHLSAVSRRLAIAGLAALVAFVLLTIHVFVPIDALQWAALACTGGALIAAWTAVLGWRMPVFSHRTLWTFTAIWGLALAASILLVPLSSRPQSTMGWRIAVQWLAFSLSLCAGSLQFRALFYRRSTPLLGRFASLASPMIVLVLIVLAWLQGPLHT